MTKRERLRRAQIAREHPFVACVNCRSGWVTERIHGHPVDEFFVTRCSCWLAHQSKVDQLAAATRTAKQESA